MVSFHVKDCIGESAGTDVNMDPSYFCQAKVIEFEQRKILICMDSWLDSVTDFKKKLFMNWDLPKLGSSDVNVKYFKLVI